MHMRAQLLRAEQEKELMRVKLEEEVAEREKAQRQVEAAKKIMLGGAAGGGGAGGGGGGGGGAGGGAGGAGGRKGRGNRRETWCPGRSAWELPADGGGDGAGGRKRAAQHSLLGAPLFEDDGGDEPEGGSGGRRRGQRLRLSDEGGERGCWCKWPEMER